LIDTEISVSIKISISVSIKISSSSSSSLQSSGVEREAAKEGGEAGDMLFRVQGLGFRLEGYVAIPIGNTGWRCRNVEFSFT
jgi:hypothetical protein